MTVRERQFKPLGSWTCVVAPGCTCFIYCSIQCMYPKSSRYCPRAGPLPKSLRSHSFFPLDWLLTGNTEFYRSGGPQGSSCYWTVLLQSMGSQRVRHDWVTEQQQMATRTLLYIFHCKISFYFFLRENFSQVELSWSFFSHLVLSDCDPMDCSRPGFPVLHYLLEFAQTHVHPVNDAIQPSHSLPPLLLWPSTFPSTSLFQWVSSLHHVAKVLELQLQHQSFQRIFRVDLFRTNWFDLLAIQRTLKSLLQHHSSNASILQHSKGTQPSLWSNSHIHTCCSCCSVP